MSKARAKVVTSSYNNFKQIAMKTKLLLSIFAIAALSSCTTMYKSGQTPDDVYFSPAPVYNDYVRRDTKDDNTVYNNPDVYNTEDRTIRRRINNRRYRRYDDRYNYPYGYNNGYNKYPVYRDTKTNNNTNQPRKYNLDVYKNNPAPANTNTAPTGKLGTQQNTENNTAPVRKFNSTTNSGSDVGNFIRKVFSGSGSEGANNNSYQGSNNNNTSGNNSKSSNSNNTSNSSSSNSNSSNVPVRKFN